MWALITLAGLVLLIGLALAVPMEAALRLDMYGRPRFRVKLAWLFGLVSREMTRAGPPAAREKEKRPEGKRRPGDVFSIFNILKTRGLLRQAMRLVKDIFRLPRLKEFLADLKVGLGDPADTGLLFAVIGPASALLHSRFPGNVQLQPDFADDAILEGYISGKVRLRPIQLVPPLLRFVFSRAVARTVWKLVVNRWKEKKWKSAAR